MNSAQLASLLRTLVQMLVAYAVGRGWIDASIAAGLSEQLVAVVVALGTLGLTLYGLKGRGLRVVAAPEAPTAAAVPAIPAPEQAKPDA